MQYRAQEDAFVVRQIGEESVIVPINAPLEKVYQTNSTGTVLVRALAEWRSEQELFEVLRAEFEAPSDEQLANDVRSFLRAMEEVGFVEAK